MTATPSPMATEPVDTATAPPSPTATTPPAPADLRSVAWLVDVQEGTTLVLRDERATPAERIYRAEFLHGGEGVVTNSGVGTQTFDLAGHAIEAALACATVAGGIEIDGRAYDAPACGASAPGSRWMIYGVDGGTYTYDSGSTVPMSDYWLLDLDGGGRRLLQEGLVSCGGCDHFWSLEWSSSGDSVMFTETGGEGRVFLGDLASGSSQVVGHGNDRSLRPHWSAADDLAVLPAADGRTGILDPRTGAVRELSLEWPARWDASGTTLYSPTWGGQGPANVTIFDPSSDSVVVRLPGQPEENHYWYDQAVVMVFEGGRYLAALQGAPACHGTQVYAPDGTETCVERGVGPVLSPDGARVAIAQQHPGVAPTPPPGSDPPTLHDIVILDVATGATVTVVRDVPGRQEPLLRWNEQGTHLLVVGPMAYGL